MIEMIALVLFVTVLVAMIAAPDHGSRVATSDAVPSGAVKPSIVQTA